MVMRDLPTDKPRTVASAALELSIAVRTHTNQDALSALAASGLPALPAHVLQQHILSRVPFATRGTCRALRALHDSGLAAVKLSLPISAYNSSPAVPSGLARLLSRLPNLRKLHCGGHTSEPETQRPVFNVAILTSLSRLTSLQLVDLNVSDIQLLRQCTVLVHVELRHCIETDVTLRHVDACSALTHLTVRQCNLRELPTLTGCADITHLDMSNEDTKDNNLFHSIATLAACPRLQSLNLQGTSRAVSDISILSTCAELTDLNLGNNLCRTSKRLTSIAPLASCTALTALSLGGQEGLVSIDPLACCTRLQTLNLHACCGISDLSPISGCSGLVDLDLSHSGVWDLMPLGGCHQLTRLLLAEVKADITVLAGCRSLVTLVLSGSDVVDVSPLQHCGQLTDLQIQGNRRLVDVQPLARCSQLACLNLTSTGVSDLTPLQPCQQLTSLRIGGCRSLFNIEPLAHHLSLQLLSAYNIPVVSFAALGACRQLTSLQLCSSLISDLTPLQRCQQLKALHLSNCASLVDIGPLENCQQLTFLDLKWCKQLTDIGSLRHLSSLMEVHLSYSPIASIAALGHCTRLTRVDASHCSADANDVSSLAACTRLTELDVLGWSVSTDVRPLAACQSLKRLLVPVGIRGLRALKFLAHRSLSVYHE